MDYIKGKYRKSIFKSNDTSFIVGLFRVEETNSKDIDVPKVITFTGNLPELNTEDKYVFKGEFVSHPKYGYQFNVSEYEKIIPTERESIIEFLTSSFIKGCGIKTAEKIYELYGDKSLDKIRENKENLLLVQSMTSKRAESIYNSIIKYDKVDGDLLYLKNLGFSLNDAMKIINIYGSESKNIIEYNIYDLKDEIDFNKLDNIFLNTNKKDDKRRVNALIIESMKDICFKCGDVYLDKIDIILYLESVYHLSVDINDNLKELILNKEIVNDKEDYYLLEYYLDEVYNAESISKLASKKPMKINKIDKLISKVESKFNIKYSNEQKEAIKNALENSISIITGGPGTGKTTVINGILEIYKIINKLSSIEKDVLLLAPTGRAARKMFEITGYEASTIHRFLKWDKDKNSFKINEFNKEHYKLIIIDEVSMIDNHLLASLFKGLNLNTKIVFIGDEYQLPSVSPGLILNDMINSEVLAHTRLEEIYRQSDNSYIPVLARSIKDVDLYEELLDKRDDYNFIVTKDGNIRSVIKEIVLKSLKRNLNENNTQVLAPMYKGVNGIDNLNILLQDIYNPKSSNKNEYTYINRTFREGDKVLNLENFIDFNISNGDIGFIINIDPFNKDEIITVDYDGNLVSYNKEMLTSLTHAYAISIHKSQGNEFDHVIMPLSLYYSRMLYNKLIYTGVSRAKKSLILVGEPLALQKAVYNNYSEVRKTKLKLRIQNMSK